MSLPVPGVGLTFGPQWATDVNSCLTIIDGHNHTPGYGVAIPSAGININADLPFNNNNLTLARALRMSPQSAVLTLPADINEVYVVGVDLYYNDGSGNNVRITQSGAVAGTPGSIANLVPPASASYVSLSGTFVFQSNTNTAANMDIASLLLRNSTANSFSLTLAPPNAMSSDTVITLPNLPAVDSVMTINSSGNIGTLPVNTLVPTSTVLDLAGSSIPGGYLLCDNSAVSRTTYSALFAQIGTTYGPGDGSTTFNLPGPSGAVLPGLNAIPSYVQSYWKMNQSSGSEPNFATVGGTYDLMPIGSIPSAAGWVSGINSRGPFVSSVSHFTVPLLNSTTTPYDVQPFVWGFWMKTNVSGVSQQIMGKDTLSGAGWRIGINTSNFIVVNFNDGPDIAATSGNVADGAWHLVFVANLAPSGAGNFRIYVDNAVVFGGAGQSYTPAPLDLTVGGLSAGSAPAFNGYLTLVEFWDQVPANFTQFTNLANQRWNGGAGIDYTPEIPQTTIIKI